MGAEWAFRLRGPSEESPGTCHGRGGLEKSPRCKGVGGWGRTGTPGQGRRSIDFQTTGDSSRGSRQPNEIRGCDHFCNAAWTSEPPALHQALPHAGKGRDWVLAFVDLPRGGGARDSTAWVVSGCQSVRESSEKEDQPGVMRGGQRLLEGAVPTLHGEP